MNDTRSKILKVLKEYGPVTSREAAELMDRPRSTIASALCKMTAEKKVQHDRISTKYSLIPPEAYRPQAEPPGVTLSGLQVVTIRALVPRPSAETPMDSLANIIRYVLSRRLSHKIKWEDASTDTVKLNPQLRDIE